MIQREEGTHAVRTMCRALGVSTSGYYAWRSRPESAREAEDRRLAVEVRAVHRESRGTYGAPRVHAELRARGVACSKKRVARLMREAGVSGKAPKRRKRGEPTGPLAPVAENVLDRAFQPAAPDQAWAADITQVWTGEGWLYLAVVLDLFSRRVVGWASRPSLSRALAIDALTKAVRDRRPSPGLLHHSDQDSQYMSHDYQPLVRRRGLVPSMSRRGNCHDNAPTESFHSRPGAGRPAAECVSPDAGARAHPPPLAVAGLGARGVRPRHGLLLDVLPRRAIGALEQPRGIHLPLDCAGDLVSDERQRAPRRTPRGRGPRPRTLLLRAAPLGFPLLVALALLASFIARYALRLG